MGEPCQLYEKAYTGSLVGTDDFPAIIRSTVLSWLLPLLADWETFLCIIDTPRCVGYL